MPVQVLECNRRRAIHLTLNLLAYGLLRPNIRIAFAQSPNVNVDYLSTSEKILLDGILYKDIAAYLAFDQIADQVSRQLTRGEDAAEKFDQAYNKIRAQAADMKADALNGAIQRGVLLNCILTSAATNATTSVERLFASAAPPLALAGTIARQMSDQLGVALTDAKSASELIDTIAGVELIPIVPAASAGRFLDARVKMLAQESGVTGLVAQTFGLVAKDQQLVAAMQTSFDGLSQGIAGWAEAIRKLSETGNDVSRDVSNTNLQEVQGMAAAMSAAVDLLRDVHGINQKTVSEVSSGVNIAGAALSGAMAGATFGPIGAVVGGAVGLLGGVFGGHGGSDRSAQALARMQNEMSQLGQAMNQLSVQMAVGFDSLSKQMNNDFTTLSSQIQSLRNEVRDEFSKLVADIQKLEQEFRQVLNTNIKALMDDFRAKAITHELRYRAAQIDPQSITSQTLALETEDAVFESVVTGVQSASNAFGNSLFVGDRTFGEYLDSFSKDLCALTQNDVSRAIDLPWMPPVFGNRVTYIYGGTGFVDQFSLKLEAIVISNRLRDSRYGNTSDINGAVFVQGVKEYCLAQVNLESFPDSDEGKLVAHRPEIMSLIPDLQNIPPAHAPEDVAYLMSRIKDATDLLSNTSLMKRILNWSVDYFKDQVSMQYLLTGQNSLPLLLYARRKLAAELADSAAVVFCNPFMAAVDVLRRLLSIKLTEGPDFKGASDNTSRIFDGGRDEVLHQVNLMLQGYSRPSMPLSNVADTEFDTGDFEERIGGGAVFVPKPIAQFDFFKKTSVSIVTAGPNVPFGVPRERSGNDWGVREYVSSQASLIVNNCAFSLPDVVRNIHGKMANSEAALTKHLETIRSSCLILGVIENCIQARLKALVIAAGSDAAPSFDPWFEGFLEYGMVAAHALGKENATETDLAVTILESMLGGVSSSAITTFSDPLELPKGLTEWAKPYPVQLGHFWGWGAENIRPGVGTDPELLKALLRPECALVGENGAIVAAAQTFSEMNIDLQMLEGKAGLLSLIQKQSPNVRDELREQLRVT